MWFEWSRYLFWFLYIKAFQLLNDGSVFIFSFYSINTLLSNMENEHRPFNILTLVTTVLAVVRCQFFLLFWIINVFKIAWLILFVGACVGQIHGVSWWIIIYQLIFVVFVVVLLLTKRFNKFQEMVLASIHDITGINY